MMVVVPVGVSRVASVLVMQKVKHCQPPLCRVSSSPTALLTLRHLGVDTSDREYEGHCAKPDNTPPAEKRKGSQRRGASTSSSSTGIVRTQGQRNTDASTSSSERTRGIMNVGRDLSESTFRGAGQVVFCNSPVSGVVFLSSLMIGDPLLAAMASLGTATATVVAKASGLDDVALRDGLYGYNGCLVGCASAVFVPSAFLLTTVMGAAATPFVVAALRPACGSVPQWTLAFNTVAMVPFLRMKPLANVTLSPPLDEAAPSTESLATIAELPSEAIIGDSTVLLLNAPLRGISEIFVADSNLGGVAILGGIAIFSPMLAGHALMGSTIGAAAGYMTGADMDDVAFGLWGYNSALTSMAVGSFFQHNRASVILSVGGAAAAAGAFGALQTVFVDVFSVPCLTVPFCIVASGCYLLGSTGVLPGLSLAASPHSPERNV